MIFNRIDSCIAFATPWRGADRQARGKADAPAPLGLSCALYFRFLVMCSLVRAKEVIVKTAQPNHRNCTSAIDQINLFIMKNLLFFLLPFLLLSNECCKNEPIENNPPQTDAILIRIKNAGAFDYQNVYVNTTGGENEYGNLQAGQYTEYKEFELAYQYAYIRLEVNGVTIALQPIDYVGEIPLEKGNYTYEVTTDGTRENLGMVFKVD